jgi:hypothetical protein
MAKPTIIWPISLWTTEESEEQVAPIEFERRRAVGELACTPEYRTVLANPNRRLPRIIDIGTSIYRVSNPIILNDLLQKKYNIYCIFLSQE